ncbi:enoyl-CoA hydratase/isomerase family protein [Chloroflexota bacterium]
MKYEGLTLAREGDTAILTLNRPEQLNAISIPMIESLEKVLDEVSRDTGLKVIIITGAGRGFCAGLDVSALSELATMSRDVLGKLMQDLTLPLYNFTKPVIAAVNGVAAGAGLAIALLCDIRIGSEKALFTSGYIRMGLTPDIGSTHSLPRLIGTAKAMELMLTGDAFDAAEACRTGILNRMVPEEELMKAAGEMAAKIASGPPIAIRLTRQAIRQGAQNNLEKQLEIECSGFYTCLRTEDHKEGLTAFQKKRKPEFKGK